MPAYPNLDGKSGVRSYELEPDAIVVTFTDGPVYRYDATRSGRATVEQMKVLAANGRGLNGYINRHVRDRYAAKLA